MMRDYYEDLVKQDDKMQREIERAEEQKRAAAERVRKLKRQRATKRKAAERKARNHALIVLGSIVADAISDGRDGDWECVDYGAVRSNCAKPDFRAYLRDYMSAPELDPAAAAARLRTWESTGDWVPNPEAGEARDKGAR